VALTHLQRRILTVLGARERITTPELLDVLSVSPEEFEAAARSLCEAQLLLTAVPLGAFGFSPAGWWELTPHGRDALRADGDSP
jgi:hypothetical protein